MAVNMVTWIGNQDGAKEPLTMLGKFQAGATQAIKRGEVLKISSTNWVPSTVDYSSTADTAIANEEIKSGDLAGYYEIIVPRKGDIFEYPLDSASAVTVGTAVKLYTSQSVSTSGSNAIGYIVGQENYPQKQTHLSDGQVGDSGTTVKSVAYARMRFKNSVSYLTAVNGE